MFHDDRTAEHPAEEDRSAQFLPASHIDGGEMKDDRGYERGEDERDPRPQERTTEVVALIDRRKRAQPSRRAEGDGEEKPADQRCACPSDYGQAQNEHRCRSEEGRQREPTRALTAGKEQDHGHGTLESW